jgi:hypothetical protein
MSFPLFLRFHNIFKMFRNVYNILVYSTRTAFLHNLMSHMIYADFMELPKNENLNITFEHLVNFSQM